MIRIDARRGRCADCGAAADLEVLPMPQTDPRSQRRPRLPARRLRAALGSATCLALLLAACLKVPYTGRRHLILIPWDTELQLGADAYTELLKSEKVVGQGDESELVGAVGKRLSRITPKQFRSMAWEFKLLSSKDVNAFCLPGGKVAVYTGILPVMKTEAGLAAVVGHEIGHAVARHGAERITGGMLLQLGLGVADVSLSNSEVHDELMGLLGLGAAVGVVLPFSRANELEADYLGGVFMAKAGYDPHEAVEVWKRMTSMHGDNPLPLLSTHPSNNKRIERLEEEMKTFSKYYGKAKKKLGKGKEI
jgi:predicted Zn-dependent protease